MESREKGALDGWVFGLGGGGRFSLNGAFGPVRVRALSGAIRESMIAFAKAKPIPHPAKAVERLVPLL